MLCPTASKHPQELNRSYTLTSKYLPQRNSLTPAHPPISTTLTTDRVYILANKDPPRLLFKCISLINNLKWHYSMHILRCPQHQIKVMLLSASPGHNSVLPSDNNIISKYFISSLTKYLCSLQSVR